MRVVITLGRHPRSWQLMDAPDAEAWLDAQPWLNEHPPLVARLCTARWDEGLERLRQSFRARAAHARWIGVEEEASHLRDALRQHLGLERATDDELERDLARRGQLTPLLIAVRLPTDAAPELWQRDAQALIERVSKQPDGEPLGVLLLSGKAGSLRLDLGWPTAFALQRNAVEQWSDYLHERCAWHAGGDIEIAASLSERLSSLPIADDRCLEEILNVDAQQRLARLPDTLREAAASDLSAFQKDPSLCLHPALPVTPREGQVVSWAARGLLVSCPNHPHKRQLISAVACRPLAMRLLGRCHALEVQIKDAYIDHLSMGPGAEPERIHALLCGNAECLERRIRPPLLPLPSSAWEQAGLGTLMHRGQIRPQDRDTVDTLRRLRNALAHGSPVGWEAVQEIIRLEERVTRAFAARTAS